MAAQAIPNFDDFVKTLPVEPAAAPPRSALAIPSFDDFSKEYDAQTDKPGPWAGAYGQVPPPPPAPPPTQAQQQFAPPVPPLPIPAGLAPNTDQKAALYKDTQAVTPPGFSSLPLVREGVMNAPRVASGMVRDQFIQGAKDLVDPAIAAFKQSGQTGLTEIGQPPPGEPAVTPELARQGAGALAKVIGAPLSLVGPAAGAVGMAAAPTETAVSIGLGLGAQAVTKDEMLRRGVPPEYADLGSLIAGLAIGGTTAAWNKLFDKVDVYTAKARARVEQDRAHGLAADAGEAILGADAIPVTFTDLKPGATPRTYTVEPVPVPPASSSGGASPPNPLLSNWGYRIDRIGEDGHLYSVFSGEGPGAAQFLGIRPEDLPAPSGPDTTASINGYVVHVTEPPTGVVRPGAPKPTLQIVDDQGNVVHAGSPRSVSQFLGERDAKSVVGGAPPDNALLDQRYSEVVQERAEAQSAVDRREFLRRASPEQLATELQRLEAAVHEQDLNIYGRPLEDGGFLRVEQPVTTPERTDLDLVRRLMNGEPVGPDFAARQAMREADRALSDIQKQRAQIGAEGTQKPQGQRAEEPKPTVNAAEFIKARKAYFEAMDKAAVAHMEKFPGVSFEDALKAVEGTVGREPQEEDFAPPQEPVEEPPPPPKPEPPSKVETVGPLTPNPPTASQMTIPESPATLAIQLEQTVNGLRKAVMFPGGYGMPAYGSIPEGLRQANDDFGNQYLFNPEMTTRGAIESAAHSDKLSEILGHHELGLGTVDKKHLQEPLVIVASRAADGTEVQSIVTDQAHLETTLAAAYALTPPGGTVTIDGKGAVGERLGEPAPQQTQTQTLGDVQPLEEQEAPPPFDTWEPPAQAEVTAGSQGRVEVKQGGVRDLWPNAPLAIDDYRQGAEPMLDLHHQPTGWLRIKLRSGTALLHPWSDHVITFLASNDKSGSDAIRANAEAQAYAIDHPVAAQQPSAPTPVTVQPRLPKSLAGAKPRYNYGQKAFELDFASDVDKAAFITAQQTRSKADAGYLDFVKQATGASEAAIRAYGGHIKEAIKALARDGEPGRLTVPDMSGTRIGLGKKPAPAAAPAAAPAEEEEGEPEGLPDFMRVIDRSTDGGTIEARGFKTEAELNEAIEPWQILGKWTPSALNQYDPPQGYSATIKPEDLTEEGRAARDIEAAKPRALTQYEKDSDEKLLKAAAETPIPEKDWEVAIGMISRPGMQGHRIDDFAFSSRLKLEWNSKLPAAIMGRMLKEGLIGHDMTRLGGAYIVTMPPSAEDMAAHNQKLIETLPGTIKYHQGVIAETEKLIRKEKERGLTSKASEERINKLQRQINLAKRDLGRARTRLRELNPDAPEAQIVKPPPPYTMSLREFSKTPEATKVPSKSVLTVNLDEQTADSLMAFSAKELRALATVLTSPQYGTKAFVVDKILKYWALRTKLKDTTMESLKQLRNSELEEMTKSVGHYVSSNKHGLAAGLLNWRNSARQEGQSRIAEANWSESIRRALAKKADIPESVLAEARQKAPWLFQADDADVEPPAPATSPEASAPQSIADFGTRFPARDKWGRPMPTANNFTYFTGKTNGDIAAMAATRTDIGLMISPDFGHYLKEIANYPVVTIDNGAFYKTPTTPEQFEKFLANVAAHPEAAKKVYFVAAPDVVKHVGDLIVGDPVATIAKFDEWEPKIHALGLPVAFVAQTGVEDMQDQIPWDRFEVLFIGGSTEWKVGDFGPMVLDSELSGQPLGTAAQRNHEKSEKEKQWRSLFATAREKGKPVHVGRVNSFERAELVQWGLGEASADGTYLAYGPDKNLPQLTSWLDRLNSQTDNHAPEPEQKKPGEFSFGDRVWFNGIGGVRKEGIVQRVDDHGTYNNLGKVGVVRSGGKIFSVKVGDLHLIEEAKPEEPETDAAPESDKPATGVRGLVDAIYNKIVAGQSLGNVTELDKLAEQHFGASRASGAWDPKDMYDAMEAAVNKYLITNGDRLLVMDPIDGLKELRELMARLTTQAIRTDEQIQNQQFSTPPTEAYVAAIAAALRPDDVVLEPSAGTGGLAAWPKAIGARVYVNEIAPRRREMLDIAGFGTATAHDGELINAFLDRTIKPTVIIMNPPFSASTLKSNVAKNNSKYGFNHVESALQRLAAGGRLVVILGGGQANEPEGGASFNGKKSGEWFKKIARKYNIRANIRVDGKEYAKYGTSFATRIIVIDKDGPTQRTDDSLFGNVVRRNVGTLEEAYEALRPVISSRPEVVRQGIGGSSETPIRGSGEEGSGLSDESGNQGGPAGDLAGLGGFATDSASDDSLAGESEGIGSDSEDGELAGGSGSVRGPADTIQSETPGGGSALHEPDIRTGQHNEPETTAGAGTPAEHADEQRPTGEAGLEDQSLIDEIAAGLEALIGKPPIGKQPAKSPEPKTPATSPRPKPARGPRAAAPAPAPPKAENPFDAAAQAAKDRLRKLLGDIPQMSESEQQAQKPKLDRAILADLGLIGAKHIYDGALKYEDWARVMMDDVGDLVRQLAKSNRIQPLEVLRQIHAPAAAAAKRFGAEPEATPAESEFYPTGDKLHRLYLERQEPSFIQQDDTEAYVKYQPTLKGPEHPGDIVETKTMATIPLPAMSYRPALPKSVIENGTISNVQLEAVVMFGQANDTILPDGSRGSALDGDGTGVGKGRIAAAVLWDNWLQGRKRLVWVSEKNDLMQDAARDFTGIGAGDDLLRGVEISPVNGRFIFKRNSSFKNLTDWNGNAEIKHEGVIFVTYAALRADSSTGRARAEQLRKWLAGDDEADTAYMLFDESHNLKNAVPSKGSKASKTGVRTRELLGALPGLRTASLSATAATEISNLGYLDRLGLWGPGTSFPGGFMDFQTAIGSGRLAAMELVARELKAQGKYISRTLSFKGVTYDTETHNLNDDQKAIYRAAARAWRKVFESAHTTIEDTNNGGKDARSKFNQAFYGAQLRFFGILASTLKIPTAVKLAEKALAQNKSVVISLVNTNEAAQNREKEKAAARSAQRIIDGNEDEEDDEYDFGPKEMLINLILKNYPIQQWADDVDENGKPIKVPVTEMNGQGDIVPVINEQAREERDALIEEIEEKLSMPGNPLDVLVEALGGRSKVAELTGRKERLDPLTQKFVSRGDPGVARKDINISEMKKFQNGEKRVAVLSSAAGTGISLHADRGAKNQQKRVQITLQVGWSADKQMQMFGRTHRTNQAHPPEYIMLVSDLGGEKRFISTIARRLGSLGALTKGQKNASTGTDLMEKVNFETDQGRAAARAFYLRLLADATIPGTDLKGYAILNELSVGRKDPDSGQIEISDAEMRNVTRLLNRLLALDPDVQNPVYNYYFEIFEAAVRAAIEDGTLDTGVKAIKGDEFHIKEERLLTSDPVTGAKTFYYPVEAKVKLDRVSPEQLEKSLNYHGDENPRILRNEKGKVTLAVDATPKVHADGRIEPASRLQTPGNAAWRKVTNARLHELKLQPVTEWAAELEKKHQQDMVEAERRLMYAKREYAASAEQEKAKRVREAEALMASAQASLRFQQYQQSLQRPDSIAYAESQVRAAQTAIDEAQKWDKPNPSRPWIASGVTDAEKGVAEAQAPITAHAPIAADPMAWAKEQWATQYEASPTHETEEYHLIGGAVLKYWNAIREASPLFDIYTAVDSKTGQRIVGVSVQPQSVERLIARISGGRATVTTNQLLRDVLINGTTFDLEGGIRIVRGRIARNNVIQFITSNDGAIANLKRMGIMTQYGITPIHYLPTEASKQKSILEQILAAYPVVQAAADPNFSLDMPEFDTAGPMWFSQLERTIEEKMPAKASPAQIAAIVGNPQNAVKPDEVKWTGLREWLQEQKGSVTKQQVLEFIRANGVQVKEVLYGGPKKSTAELKELYDKRDDIRDELRQMGLNPEGSDERHGWALVLTQNLEQVRREIREASSEGQAGPAKYSKYTAPGGGRDYGELLLTLPPRPDSVEQRLREIDRQMADKKWLGASRHTDPELQAEWDQLMEERNQLLPQQQQKPTLYQSSHWEGVPNVVAHIRFATRTAPDGKRTLLIEEIQSDWHQQGRDKGYRPGGAERKELERQLKEADAAHSRAAEARHKALDAVKYPQIDHAGLRAQWLTPAELEAWGILDHALRRDGNLPAANLARWRELKNKAAAYGDAVKVAESEAREKAKLDLAAAEAANTEAYNKYHELNKRFHSGVPDAPFQKTWHELAFRRALRWAAENGFDRIAWTTGKQQAGRYDLSKQVSKVTWEPDKDHGAGDHGNLAAYDKSGTSIYNQRIPVTEIPDVIGKDVARKLLNSPLVADNAQRGYPYGVPRHTLEGDNLQVGGHGMNEFYDQILPRYAEKFGKKWGAKVEDTRIKTPTKASEKLYTGPDWTVEQLEQHVKDMAHERGPGSITDIITAMTTLHQDFKSAMELYGNDVVANRLGGKLERRPQSQTVHSMTIPPAMKESVLAGQPLFAGWDSVEGATDQPGTTGPITARYKNGVVFTNRRGMIKVGGTWGRPHASGVRLTPTQAETAASSLDRNPETAPIAKLIRAHVNPETGIIVVSSSEGLTALKQHLRHERFHVTQSKLGGHLGDYEQKFLNSPLGARAAHVLGQIGYVRGQHAYEIGARLAAGQFVTLGLTRDEAKTLARMYFTILRRVHGDAKIDSVIDRGIIPAIAKEARRDENTGRTGTDRKEHEGRSSGIERDGGRLRSVVRSNIPGEPQFARGPGEPSGFAQFIQSLKSADDEEVTGKRHFSRSAMVQRLVMPGRNLQEIREANRAIYNAAVRAGASRSIASVIMHNSLPQITASLKGTGISVQQLFSAYQESRLRAIQQRYQGWADDVDALDDEQTRKAVLEIFPNGRSRLLDMLQLIDEKMENLGLQQLGAAMVEREDWAGLRNLAHAAFIDAADSVVHTMDPDTFTQMVKAVKTNPPVKKADELYADLVERPIAESHQLHDGIFANDLGVLDRFFPLMVEKKNQNKLTAGRTVPFRSPQNMNNFMAMGMSKTGYTTDIPMFSKRVASSIRAAGKANLLQVIAENGWLKPEPANWYDNRVFKGPDGVTYQAVSEENKAGRTIIVNGRVIATKTAKVIMPRFIREGLDKILAPDNNSPNDLQAALQWLSMISTKGPLPFEVIFHGTGMLGALYGNTPFLAGDTVMQKVLTAPLIKYFTIRQGLFSADVKPSTPENAHKLLRIARAGALPGRTLGVTYNKETAETTGAKLHRFSFEPILYGPNGIDTRARLMLYDMAMESNPNMSDEDLGEFINQLGNYTPEFQSAVESFLKLVTLGPFATAGMTRIVNGYHAATGTGPKPEKGTPAWNWARAFALSALAALGLYILTYKGLTGKWPTQDRTRFKMWKIPVDSRGRGVIDKHRHSMVGDLLWGKGPEVGYINFGAIAAPLMYRVTPKTAIDRWMHGGSPEQVMDGVKVDVTNTLAHPALGPVTRMAFVAATGSEPYVGDFHDARGKAAPSLFPALPKMIKPGFVGGFAPSMSSGRPTTKPGFGGRTGATLAAALGQLTPNALLFGEASGLMGNDAKNGSEIFRTIMDLNPLTAGIFSPSSNPYAAENYLMQQKRMLAQAPMPELLKIYAAASPSDQQDIKRFVRDRVFAADAAGKLSPREGAMAQRILGLRVPPPALGTVQPLQ